LLIDSHAMVRESLADLLAREADLTVAGQAASCPEALDLVISCGANLVLTEVDLGDARAIGFVSRSRSLGYRGRFLVVTAGLSDQEALQLIYAGVGGIVHKTNSFAVLCEAVRQVARGEAWLEKAYLSPLLRANDRTRANRLPNLTERDKAVLRYLLEGLSNRIMGERLEISEGAVKASLRHVCQKLGVRTRTQLVKAALEDYRHEI
jgi:two-component system nitrate/nitrite response regulator NarL